MESKTHKKIFFLLALPRSGNTLFGSIMNQNPDIAVTANSITLEIMKDVFLLKETDVFQNYPDHKSLNNVLSSVYNTYYKDWNYKYIIDRGPVMTPGNLMLMNANGGIAKELMAIQNALKPEHKHMCHFLKYDELVNDTENQINKIYDFLEIPRFNHNLKSLNQFKVNGIGYDDKVVGNRMHTIREEIRKESNPYRAMIPESIARAYGHIVL